MDKRPSFRAIGVDPGIINMGIAVIAFYGYRRDVRVIAATEAKYGKNCSQLQDIPCDVPDMEILTSEHWDVRNSLGSLAPYTDDNLKTFLETPEIPSRKSEYAFQVLSPNMYLHKYDTIPSYRDTVARILGQHALMHEKYISFTGTMELPAVLVENQQDQVHGRSQYGAPAYTISNSILTGFRSIDTYRGEYGRIILNHAKKWGIDRKSTNSDENASEYRDRKNMSERETFDLLAANGHADWIDTLLEYERAGYKLDDRCDAILIAVHWLATLFDAYTIRDGTKHKSAIEVRNGFTSLPAVLKRPLGRDEPRKKAPRKKKPVAKLTPEEEETRNNLRNSAIEKLLRDKKRTRDEAKTPPSERPAKRAKMASPLVDLTKSSIPFTANQDDDGYISDSWVENGGGITYEDLMDQVTELANASQSLSKTRRKRTPAFAGTLQIRKLDVDPSQRKRAQSKIERFFKPKNDDEIST